MFDDVIDGLTQEEVRKLKKNYVIFIVDESGSMSGKSSFVESTIKEQLDEIKKQTDFDTEVYVRKFSSKPDKLIKIDLDNLNLKYQPNGMTALYDAVGLTINKFSEIKEPVLMVVITDGYENNSKEFTSDTLQALTKSKQDEGNWTLIYLGSDHDIHEQSHDVTCYAANTMSFTSDEQGYKVMSRSLTKGLSNYYDGCLVPVAGFFTDNTTENDK